MASTTFLLIRHAAHSLDPNILAGRSTGVHLSEAGRAQAKQLVDRLAGVPIQAIYCSPLDRTRETAQPLADQRKLPIGVDAALNELDYGQWTRRGLEELRSTPSWSRWNDYRSGTRIPGGELMLEVQLRMIRFMENLRHPHSGECVALFSHGDVIKSVVAYALGVAMDLFRRIDIGLASISIITLDDHGPRVLCVNHHADVPLPE